MPNIKSQIKRVGVTAVENARNNAKRTKVKNAIKKFNVAVEAKDAAAAKTLLQEAASVIGAAKSDGVLTPNSASRKVATISRLYDNLINPEKAIKKAEVAAAATAEIVKEKQAATDAAVKVAAEKKAAEKAAIVKAKVAKVAKKAADKVAAEKAVVPKAPKAAKKVAPVEAETAEKTSL